MPDNEKGGTWGRCDRADQPVLSAVLFYVRTTERTPKGNQALIERGAIAWALRRRGPDAFQSLLTDGVASVEPCRS